MSTPQSTTSAPGAASATTPLTRVDAVDAMRAEAARIRAADRTGHPNPHMPDHDADALESMAAELVARNGELADDLRAVLGNWTGPVAWCVLALRDRARDDQRRRQYAAGAYHDGQGACFATRMRVGRERLTAAQCAEMTADMAAMGVAS